MLLDDPHFFTQSAAGSKNVILTFFASIQWYVAQSCHPVISIPLHCNDFVPSSSLPPSYSSALTRQAPGHYRPMHRDVPQKPVFPFNGSRSRRRYLFLHCPAQAIFPPLFPFSIFQFLALRFVDIPTPVETIRVISSLRCAPREHKLYGKSHRIFHAVPSGMTPPLVPRTSCSSVNLTRTARALEVGENLPNAPWLLFFIIKKIHSLRTDGECSFGPFIKK